MEKFCHLHLHSFFSKLDGIPSPEEYAKKAQEKGHSYLSITDHGHANSFFRLQQACERTSVKPVFGIEMYINDNLNFIGEGGKRKRVKDRHLIVLAKNEIGYKNLLYLNFLSMKDTDHFYYSPRISTEELFLHKEGLIIGSACINSPFGGLLREGKVKEAVSLVKKFQEEFKDDFYIEIQLNEMTREMDSLKNGQKSYNNTMIAIANKFSIPIVTTGDVHYLNKGEDKLQTLSIIIRNKETIDNNNFELESKNLYYHTINDYLDFNKEYGYNYNEENLTSYCNNSVYIADKINFKIPKRKRMFLPKVTDNDDKNLIIKAKEGLCRKLGKDNYSDVNKEYRERLEYELEILIRKGFSNYFLIFEDIYRFAKEKEIMVGSSRGCFAAGNKVRMGDGCLKNIEDIKIGDSVITGNGVSCLVSKTMEYEVNEEIIEIECGDGTVIRLTKDHKILVKNKEKTIWKSAENLTEIDEIIIIEP